MYVQKEQREQIQQLVARLAPEETLDLDAIPACPDPETRITPLARHRKPSDDRRNP